MSDNSAHLANSASTNPRTTEQLNAFVGSVAVVGNGVSAVTNAGFHVYAKPFECTITMTPSGKKLYLHACDHASSRPNSLAD